MKQLKDIYNEVFVSSLGESIIKQFPQFEHEQLMQLTFKEDWPELALKQRMRRITEALYETLPKDYLKALAILHQVEPSIKEGLRGIVFPDYVSKYGLANWESSLQALETFTQYSTSEFAVRPFLLTDPERMLQQFMRWSRHNNEHVRRLASEGARPRLPWGLSIPLLKQNPSLVLPILENLKQDDSIYVRKSVANNLNDISKTHPELVRTIAKQWFGKHPYTDWIVKHACRTLLKQGDSDVLSIFGYEDAETIHIKTLSSTNEVSIGESLPFSFSIQSEQEQKIRIEYAIDYVKARGNRNRKVFKISETSIRKDEIKHYTRTHSFKDLSTRKHYKGIHSLMILINGTEKASFSFSVM
ncbi:DNA alkylation repair protein [Alkalihalobacillus sp. MEB130]|uniref:DNA alkylation repair protein n=1 Tax=Alkalihalobacillus sp. MEB130 TaxID=2976704 RepID=UPI0028DE97E3|nr:DNA alkylation repair protein [Alkalihalobacillus sp. MEB130]MDT8859676.1 DNA alkylation repair protein [Alkalihalobacillus sp. MEB130]